MFLLALLAAGALAGCSDSKSGLRALAGRSAEARRVSRMLMWSGRKPYTFELEGLPGGIVLDPATGQLSGTPSGGTGPAGEPIELQLTVRDAVGASAFDSVSIGILPLPLVLKPNLLDGQVGVY